MHDDFLTLMAITSISTPFNTRREATEVTTLKKPKVKYHQHIKVQWHSYKD